MPEQYIPSEKEIPKSFEQITVVEMKNRLERHFNAIIALNEQSKTLKVKYHDPEMKAIKIGEKSDQSLSPVIENAIELDEFSITSGITAQNLGFNLKGETLSSVSNNSFVSLNNNENRISYYYDPQKIIKLLNAGAIPALKKLLNIYIEKKGEIDKDNSELNKIETIEDLEIFFNNNKPKNSKILGKIVTEKVYVAQNTRNHLDDLNNFA